MAKVSITYRDSRVRMVSQRDADILLRLGKASLTAESPPPKTPRPKPAAKVPRTTSDESENPKSKRTYRRRDLQAEE